MRIEYKEKFYNDEYPDGYTYVGIYIYLYGCNDVVVDYLYLNYLDKYNRHTNNDTENLYEELLAHKKELSKLTSNEKLRVLVSTRFGRRDLQRFALPKNNFHFAGIDFDNNERLVPDWYINYDGPVSSYRSGNIMYSEYSNKPLDHEERLKRYHGILQQKKTITQMTAETLQRGVRRLFNLSGGPVTQSLPEVVAVLEDPPIVTVADVEIPDVEIPDVEIPEEAPPTTAEALLLLTTEPLKVSTALDKLDALMVDVNVDPFRSSLNLARSKPRHPKVKLDNAESLKVKIPTERPPKHHKAELPKAEAATKVEPPKAEAATKVEPPKASKAEALSVDTSADSTPFSTPITSPEVKMPLSGTELKKEILSKKSEDKSEATPPAYTEADATRGKQQAAKEIIEESAAAKVEAELNTIIANLPKNVKAEINNLYKEFDAPPTYNKSQIVETNKRMYETYEGINKLRALSADEMKKMAGTQYGMDGFLIVTKQRLKELTEGLVRSGVSTETAKKVNNNIIKTLLAAGEREADKFGDSIAKSKPRASKNGPPIKMKYEAFEDLLLK